jgi:uncharacterized protein
MSTREPSASMTIHAQPDGVSFEVLVVPRASRTRIVGAHAAALKVTLAAPPVDGAANLALCAFLAKALGVPKRAVRITHGEHSKTKTVQVTGVSADQVRLLQIPALEEPE